jgi:hypothetical protein
MIDVAAQRSTMQHLCIKSQKTLVQEEVYIVKDLG